MSFNAMLYARTENAYCRREAALQTIVLFSLYKYSPDWLIE